MPDLIDDPHPEFTAAMMADLTGAGVARAEPASPVGGDFAARRSSVHAGASEGVQRLPAPPAGTVLQQDLSPKDALALIETGGVAEAVEAIYTAALDAMGPDPIPIAGAELKDKVESDEA